MPLLSPVYHILVQNNPHQNTPTAPTCPDGTSRTNTREHVQFLAKVTHQNYEPSITTSDAAAHHALSTVQGGMWTGYSQSTHPHCKQHMIRRHITHTDGRLTIPIRDPSQEPHALPDDDTGCAIETCRSSGSAYIYIYIYMVYFFMCLPSHIASNFEFHVCIFQQSTHI